MKKTLLLVTFISGCFFANAQSLQSENFNALTIGNVGTDITGVTAGQGGWLTYTAVGANSNFQIVNEVSGPYVKVLQITGPANATDTRYVWKDGLNTAWAARTSGNNILDIEYDFFTGPATTSKSSTGMRLFNAAGQTMAGFQFIHETKILTGLARYNNNGTINTYSFNLVTGGLVLTANTWYRIGFSFNKTTGQVIWKGTGFYGGVIGTEIGVDPLEADFILVGGTNNTVATVVKFDGYTATATAVEALGVPEVSLASPTVTVYPNPVKHILNLSVSNNLDVSKVDIMDINGRLVKTIALNNISNKQIDVSELNAGMYLLNIYSNEGKITKKIIKE
ncbi:MAG: T9SS type A sorting domain-containing protein [Gelidibacter sp.]|nr:T9SS type A sorting domain-containing protein [Gelidibacter sp.]